MRDAYALICATILGLAVIGAGYVMMDRASDPRDLTDLSSHHHHYNNE